MLILLVDRLTDRASCLLSRRQNVGRILLSELLSFLCLSLVRSDEGLVLSPPAAQGQARRVAYRRDTLRGRYHGPPARLHAPELDHHPPDQIVPVGLLPDLVDCSESPMSLFRPLPCRSPTKAFEVVRMTGDRLDRMDRPRPRRWRNRRALLPDARHPRGHRNSGLVRDHTLGKPDLDDSSLGLLRLDCYRRLVGPGKTKSLEMMIGSPLQR